MISWIKGEKEIPGEPETQNRLSVYREIKAYGQPMVILSGQYFFQSGNIPDMNGTYFDVAIA